MNAMTSENLRSAFGGESQAHMRYKAWGDVADKDGFPNVGRLFRAISYAEEIHAKGHFRALKNEKGDFSVTSGAGFGIGTTSENLEAARGGELFEVEQMYPAYIAVAEMQNEKAAVATMKLALEAEKYHAELFGNAKEVVDTEKDPEYKVIYACPVCGYVAVNDTPDNCPICNAKKEIFKEF